MINKYDYAYWFENIARPCKSAKPVEGGAMCNAGKCIDYCDFHKCPKAKAEINEKAVLETTIQLFDPKSCVFEGSLNDLQQVLSETTRARIKAENYLETMNEDDNGYGLYVKYVELCMSWEKELVNEMKERMPKDQRVLV